MNSLVLLLTLTSTLVLRSGDRITVEGPVREENGVVTFRANGLLFSIPASEIETRVAPTAVATREAEEIRRLKVSAEERDRLLRELESNHTGTPTPHALPPRPPAPTKAEIAAQTREEWDWRHRARGYEEAVRQASEELHLLEERIATLENQIRSFTSLGYKPSQFTYQTSQLVHATAMLPHRRLEIARAERALAQFREDARRQGVLPGWLR